MSSLWHLCKQLQRVLFQIVITWQLVKSISKTTACMGCSQSAVTSREERRHSDKVPNGSRTVKCIDELEEWTAMHQFVMYGTAESRFMLNSFSNRDATIRIELRRNRRRLSGLMFIYITKMARYVCLTYSGNTQKAVWCFLQCSFHWDLGSNPYGCCFDTYQLHALVHRAFKCPIFLVIQMQNYYQ